MLIGPPPLRMWRFSPKSQTDYGYPMESSVVDDPKILDAEVPIVVGHFAATYLTKHMIHIHLGHSYLWLIDVEQV